MKIYASEKTEETVDDIVKIDIECAMDLARVYGASPRQCERLRTRVLGAFPTIADFMNRDLKTIRREARRFGKDMEEIALRVVEVIDMWQFVETVKCDRKVVIDAYRSGKLTRCLNGRPYVRGSSELVDRLIAYAETAISERQGGERARNPGEATGAGA